MTQLLLFVRYEFNCKLLTLVMAEVLLFCFNYKQIGALKKKEKLISN